MARRIGSRYTVHQVIGRGSAGTVWLGEGPQGPVAVKLLREDLASDQVLVGRFVQERTALTSLDHPRVVGVHDMVVDGADLALVMELVHGTDLRTLLDRDGPLAPAAAAAITADVAEGLAVAHAAGIVHRDVKPENILLDLASPTGPGGAPRAKLTDFGIARLVDAPRRTRATRIIGTPDYLAPEIIEGLEPRAAVDIYALATVLYELLAGFTPFGGGHTGAVLRRHVTESVPPLPGLPEPFARVVTECLAKAPASRLRAGELADRLRELLPQLEGIPPLVLPSPGGGGAREERAEEEYPAAAAAEFDEPSATRPGQRRRRGPAVPLVAGRRPDSSRDTHTSLRRPSHEELAAYAAESRAQRARAEAAKARTSTHRRPGQRPGAAAVFRRRRLIAAAVALLVAGGAVAAYAASGGDDGSRTNGQQSSGDATGTASTQHAQSDRPNAPVAQQADASASAAAEPLPAWSAWTPVPPPPTPLGSGLRAARVGDTELVFGTDRGGSVWYLTRTGAGFGGWTKLTGIHVMGEPSPVALSGGRVRLFALGSDGLYYQRTLSAVGGTWTPWGQLDGRTHYDSPPAAVSTDGGDVVLVGRIGGDLVTSSLQGGQWSAPATVPTAGRIAGTPELIADGPDRVDAFVVAAGGGAVLRVPAVGGVWHPAQTVTGISGAAAMGRVEAARAPSGALYVFGPGAAQLEEAVSTRSSAAVGPWRAGTIPGGAASAAPAALTDATGVALFAPTSSGSVRYAHTV